MIPIAQINQFLQSTLSIKEQKNTTAIEAARWLDAVELLKDSESRPGLPLRNLLREGRIDGQRQENNNRWYIERIEHK